MNYSNFHLKLINVVKFNVSTALNKLDKREVFLLLSFFSLAIVIRVYYFDYFCVPDTDFFNMRDSAISLSNYKLPRSYQRLPFYSYLMGALSHLIPSKRPILFAAEMINLVAFIVASLLLYIFARKLIGKMAFLALYLFAMHPLTVYLTSQPRAEMLVVTFMLLSLYLSVVGSKSSYFAAFLASLTRYEGVFLIPALGIKDFLHSRRRIIPVVLLCLSLFGIITWSVLNYHSTGHFNPYYKYFGSDLHPAGFEYFRAVIRTLVKFVRFDFYGLVPANFLAVVLLCVLILGLFSLFKKSIKDVLPLVVFLICCTILHLIFFAPSAPHVFVSMWAILIIVVAGLKPIFLLILRILDSFHANMADSTFSGRSFKAVFYCFVFTLSLFLLQKTSISAMGAFFLIVHFISFTILIFYFTAYIDSNRYFGLMLTGVLIIFSIFLTGYNVRAIEHWMHSTKSTKADLRLAGEWYVSQAAPGEKMVVSEPHVVSYYSIGSSASNFVALGSFRSLKHAEFIQEARRKGISYVLWDSHHGRLWETDYYYKKYKIFLISALKDGRDSDSFVLIKKLNAGSRYGYIYKLVIPKT